MARMAWASCPAKLTSRVQRRPSPPAAVSMAAAASGSKAAGSIPPTEVNATSRPCAAAHSRARAKSAASISASVSAAGWRNSSARRARPGTMLNAPGATSTCPQVTVPGGKPALAISAARVMNAAAPRRASRRRGRGVVPAWAACPLKVSQKERMPTMAVTTPMSSPASSRREPCSMCNSR